MPNSQNNFILLLQAIRADGTVVINEQVGPLKYAGSVGERRSGVLPDTNAHNQDLPITEVVNAYLKNTAAAGTIAVTWTRKDTGTVLAKVLGPGELLAFSAPQAGTGITALSLQASVGGVTYDMFLGG